MRQNHHGCPQNYKSITLNNQTIPHVVRTACTFIMALTVGISACSEDSSRSTIEQQDVASQPASDTELTIDFANFADIVASPPDTDQDQSACDPNAPDCATLYYCKEDLDCVDALGEIPECTVARCDLGTNTCYAAALPPEECEDIVVPPPRNAICEYTGAVNDLFECDIEAVRVSDEVPGPVSLEFELVYASTMTRFVGLRTYPCGDKTCPTDVPPASLTYGHHVSLTPDSAGIWTGTGHITIVPPDGQPNTYLTHAWLEPGGTIMGSSIIVTAVFELLRTTTTPTWINVDTPVSAGLDGVSLPTVVTNARIVVGILLGSPTEICDDETDNDGDGDVDCLDSDCAAEPNCAQESCGNQFCDTDETCDTCPADCGVCPENCGNGLCTENETCTSCPQDCGTCPEACGNGLCADGETCTSCPQDCGACPETCGNGLCAGGETCTSCPQDCGTCPPACGDGTCDPLEDCINCEQDCGACPCDTGPGTVPALPSDGICQVVGCVGDTVDCPLRIARASAGVDPATGLQFKLIYPNNSLTLENFYTTKCFGPGNCFEAPVAGVGAQPLDSGHVFSLSPSSPTAWTGSVGVVIVNFTSTSIPLTNAYLDNGGVVVGEPTFAWARFKLTNTVLNAQPATVSIPNATKNQLVAVSQKQLELLTQIINGLIITFGTP